MLPEKTERNAVVLTLCGVIPQKTIKQIIDEVFKRKSACGF